MSAFQTKASSVFTSKGSLALPQGDFGPPQKAPETQKRAGSAKTSGSNLLSLLLKMTEDDKQLVRDSWAKVMPISDKAAELFYNRLFKLDPSLRPLFTSDMTEQGRKLMRMITVAVNGLDRLDEIIPAVQELGKRHSGYGVTNDHYDTVATAFLWALERGLGDGFNEDTRNAWIKTYTLLSTTMKEAAAQPATA